MSKYLAGAYTPATDIRCPTRDVTESKSGRFSELVNDILPRVLIHGSKKTQRFLSNPTGPHLIIYQVRR